MHTITLNSEEVAKTGKICLKKDLHSGNRPTHPIARGKLPILGSGGAFQLPPDPKPITGMQPPAASTLHGSVQVPESQEGFLRNTAGLIGREGDPPMVDRKWPLRARDGGGRRESL